MPEEQIAAPPAETRWAIALDWFALNHRSAAVLVNDYLCSICVKRRGDKKEPAPKVLLATIHSCCSQVPDFINDRLPIMESAFRLFLRNGNQPLTLREMSSALNKARYGDVYRTSPELLLRILKNDHFYGLQEIIE